MFSEVTGPAGIWAAYYFILYLVCPGYKQIKIVTNNLVSWRKVHTLAQF